MKDLHQKELTNADKSAEETGQFVTFRIGEEIYGVKVLSVHEIIGMTKITHVPSGMSMNFMKGVINLRGNVVPVVDMRLKFNMPEREYDDLTVILIVELKDRLIGMIVDTVSDVVGLDSKNIQETPHFSANVDTNFIDGIGNLNDDLIIVLDIDKILTSDQLPEIDEKKIA